MTAAKKRTLTELERIIDELNLKHKAGLRLEASYHGEHRDGNWPYFLWEVTIHSSKDTHPFKTEFKCGVGNASPGRSLTTAVIKNSFGTYANVPSLGDVLCCLLLDSCAAEITFRDWCHQFDRAFDSRKALNAYLESQDTAIGLRRILGNEWFELLVDKEH